MISLQLWCEIQLFLDNLFYVVPKMITIKKGGNGGSRCVCRQHWALGVHSPHLLCHSTLEVSQEETWRL